MTKRHFAVAGATALAFLAAALLASPSGDAGAAFPGANGRIAFAGQRGIYVTGSKGNGRVVHLAGARRTQPAWSPDGRRIAYERYGYFGADIYKMTANGRKKVLLTRGDASSYSPTWAPSGEKLAFVRTPASGEAIFKMRTNGANKRRVTPKDRSFSNSPSWSPEGARIAYVCEFVRRGAQICTIRPDGSRRRILTDFNMKSASRPDWSPDGRRIVFAAGRNRAGSILHFHLYVMDADGGGLDRITPKRGHSSLLPAWSPDGRKIAFLRAGRGIMKVRADGADPRMIVPDGTYPAWQPK